MWPWLGHAQPSRHNFARLAVDAGSRIQYLGSPCPPLLTPCVYPDREERKHAVIISKNEGPISKIPLSIPPATMCLSRPVSAKTKADPISRTEDPISKNHLFIPTDTISLSGPVSARERRSKIQDRRSNVQVALSDWDPPSPLVFKVGGRAPLDTHGATASVPGAPTPNFELRVRGLYPSNRPTLNYGCGCVSVSAQP